MKVTNMLEGNIPSASENQSNHKRESCFLNRAHLSKKCILCVVIIVSSLSLATCASIVLAKLSLQTEKTRNPQKDSIFSGNVSIDLNSTVFIRVETENNVNNSGNQRKKKNLLTIFKNISGSKIIKGRYCHTHVIEDIKECLGTFVVHPFILTTTIPYEDDDADEDADDDDVDDDDDNNAVLQAWTNDTISNWNNRYLVHIRMERTKFEIHPLDHILDEIDIPTWTDLITEGGNGNKLWKKVLDKLASFLRQLETAGVLPIVDLLPFTNFKSDDYVWGGHRGLEGSLKLFRITKDYLTQYHGLTSLIWNWSLHAKGDLERLEDYWPGSNYVDVATVEMENTTELSSTEYKKLLDLVGDKPIAMEGMKHAPSTKLLETQLRWTWFTIDGYN